MLGALPHIKRMIGLRSAQHGLVARIRADGHVSRQVFEP